MNVISAKTAGGSYLATSKDIPDAGELWVDPVTANGKIGDGKTPMFELPWISCSVDLNTEPPHKYKMNNAVKNFIEQYIDLIEENRFDEVYTIISHSAIEFTRDFTRALLEAGLNPKPYLTNVPTCIIDLLINLPPYDKVDNIDNKIYNHIYDDWAGDYAQGYSKSKIDAKIDEMMEEFTKKICNSMSIPANLLTIK